jgi:hypothetical protein
MAGLDPAIHVLASVIEEDVDARHKAGHDEWMRCIQLRGTDTIGGGPRPIGFFGLSDPT